MSLTNTNLAPVVFVATIQTARTNNFIKKINQGNHITIVIDEVHRSGSNENSNVLDINSGYRLGLSATPVRSDEEETKEFSVKSKILDTQLN